MLFCNHIGVSGIVQLDDNGDRVADYWMWHLQPGQDSYVKWAVIPMTKGHEDVSLNLIQYFVRNIGDHRKTEVHAGIQNFKKKSYHGVHTNEIIP